jgi:hypothetical protein
MPARTAGTAASGAFLNWCGLQATVSSAIFRSGVSF